MSLGERIVILLTAICLTAVLVALVTVSWANWRRHRRARLTHDRINRIGVKRKGKDDV